MVCLVVFLEAFLEAFLAVSFLDPPHRSLKSRSPSSLVLVWAVLVVQELSLAVEDLGQEEEDLWLTGEDLFQPVTGLSEVVGFLSEVGLQVCLVGVGPCQTEDQASCSAASVIFLHHRLSYHREPLLFFYSLSAFPSSHHQSPR